jgi:hypothetical protein
VRGGVNSTAENRVALKAPTSSRFDPEKAQGYLEADELAVAWRRRDTGIGQQFSDLCEERGEEREEGNSRGGG